MFDVITIGDATTDVFLEIDETTKVCRVDKKKNELCIRFASKVPVKHVNRIAGVGNAANVAVGTHRLGLQVGIYTIVGGDRAGQEIIGNLRRHRVDVRYVRIDKTRATNSSTVLDYQGDRTIFVHHEEREYHLPAFAKTKWLYFSSICGNHDAFQAEIHDSVKRTGVKLGFNPGSLQMCLGTKRLMPILSICDVVFVNKEEAQALTLQSNDIRRLLRAMHRLGTKMVVITDGRNGSYAYDGRMMYGVAIINLPVLERTGCGDAYASGFLGALVHGFDLPEAMRWGSANGASEATQLGSQSGLLTRPKMEALLRRHSHFQPMVLS